MFYQSYQVSEEYNDTFALLQDMIVRHPDHCSFVDCLGMTPLHVLAALEMHDLRLYRCIIETCPDALTTKDKWGEISLTYILIPQPPIKITQYLTPNSDLMDGIFLYNVGAILCLVVVSGRRSMISNQPSIQHIQLYIGRCLQIRSHSHLWF